MRHCIENYGDNNPPEITRLERRCYMKRRAPREHPDPIDVHVGARIKARRTGLRISQSEIGKKLDVTFQQIQKYENGTNRVGASNLYRLSQALDVDVAYFFREMPKSIIQDGYAGEGLSDSATPEFDNDPMSSSEAIKLVHNYFRIANTKVRQRIFQLVKTIAETRDSAS